MRCEKCNRTMSPKDIAIDELAQEQLRVDIEAAKVVLLKKPKRFPWRLKLERVEA